MTNAKKYLKDSVAISEFIIAFRKWYYAEERIIIPAEKEIENFLREKTKPTLTEDEKVILRNIQLYTGKTVTIRRAGDGHLYISGGCGLIDFGQYNHLFQFIKERRRI